MRLYRKEKRCGIFSTLHCGKVESRPGLKFELFLRSIHLVKDEVFHRLCGRIAGLSMISRAEGFSTVTTEKTIALTRRTFVGKVMSLLLNILSRLVITFLPRSKRLLISWLQSPSAVILEPRKIKSDTVSTVSPSTDAFKNY